MEGITVRFQEDVLKRIDTAIDDFNYNSRTEFIREAVRDKLAGLTREQAIKKFLAFRGKLKGRTRLDEDEKIKWEVSREFFAELERRRLSRSPQA